MQPNTPLQYIEPKAFLSRNGEYISLLLPNGMIIRKHINFFKKIMGVPFVPKPKDPEQEPAIETAIVQTN